MAACEISVEESREGEELAAQGGDGKLSLRMKVVTPVEEGSPGSERFSLQSKNLPYLLSLMYLSLFQNYILTSIYKTLNMNEEMFTSFL